MRVAIDSTATTANSPASPRSAGNPKLRNSATPISGSAASMNGSRRPKRDRHRSDRDPIRGSATASKISPTAIADPTAAPDMPHMVVR
ncbi:hypothetical protein GCM10009087_19940 [Sphingomonas oligophenolica]